MKETNEETGQCSKSKLDSICSGCDLSKSTVNRNMFNGLCADCTTKSLYDYDFYEKSRKKNEIMSKRD